jgi:hypothetical protein
LRGEARGKVRGWKRKIEYKEEVEIDECNMKRRRDGKT